MLMFRDLASQGFPAVYAAAAAGYSHLLPILAAAGANMDARVNSTGASALHVAAVTGQAAAVAMLLQLRANTSARVGPRLHFLCLRRRIDWGLGVGLMCGCGGQ